MGHELVSYRCQVASCLVTELRVGGQIEMTAFASSEKVLLCLVNGRKFVESYIVDGDV